MSSIAKYAIAGLLLVLVLVMQDVGIWYIAKQETAAQAQAKQDTAIIKETNQLEGQYDKVDKSVPVSHDARIAWLLTLSAKAGR